MRKSFILYTSMYAPIKHLPEAQLGELFKALFDYQLDGREPSTSSLIYIPFLFFKGQFVEDEKKYQERCEKNKSNAGKRWGTKEQISPIAYAGMPSHTMDADNDNDNDNDNVNDNDNKNEIAPKVFLSLNEEKKIKEKFGDSNKWAIEKLSNYKLSSGKKYKSDYYAIIGWVFDEFIKLKNQTSKNGIQKTERTNPFFDELRAKYSNQESAEQG